MFGKKLQVRFRGTLAVSVAALSAALSWGSPAALADPQAAVAANTLSEVIVTARKREESLQDVPIAVSVVSGESVRAAGITDLQYLAPSVPGLYVAKNVALDTIQIRGIGSGTNLGFEQEVGQVIDGFFYGRSRFGRLDFLDIERVEVLKGPQGALIGKNTAAGAINITTAAPTDNFSGWISPSYEFAGDDGYTVEGAVSGPLADNFKVRLAANYDKHDGYLSDPAIGAHVPSRNNWSDRLTFVWEPTDQLSVTGRWAHASLYSEGTSDQLSYCNGFMLAFLARSHVTDEDCRADFTTSVRAPRYGSGNFVISDTTLDTVGMTTDLYLGGMTLTSLTGFARYSYTDGIEGDRTPVEVFNGFIGETPYQQLSQELRLASATGGRFDYIAGMVYLHTDQTSDFKIDVNLAPVVGAPGVLGEGTFIQTHQTGNSAAAFAQATLHISDTWAATLGGRFTHDEKEAQQQEFGTQIYTLIPLLVPPPGLPPANVHNIAQDLHENNFSPAFDLQWRPSEKQMLYASVRRGFKAGGFDNQVDAPQAEAPALFQFKPETVTAYELGAKLRSADSSAELNFDVFRSKFDNLQVSTLETSSSAIAAFRVGNAAEATTQGVEADGRWRPVADLTLGTSLTYLDAKYDQYDGAPCYGGQTVAQGCISGAQNLSGKVLPYASDWAGTLNVQYVWHMTNQYSLLGFVQGNYIGKYALNATLNPQQGFQDGFFKADAHVTLANAAQRWELSLIGRNLTDKVTSSQGDELPFVFVGSFYRFVDPPREIIVQATYRF